MILRIFAISLNTFRESLRSKVLYALLFFAVLLVLITALFGSVTIGDQVKVIKDFGLFSICLFAVAYAVIAGATLLSKELSRKTIYNILAKPVRRAEFLCGKYFGLMAVTWLMILLMALGLSAFCWLLEGRLDLTLLPAYSFIALQLLIVCALTIFFSSLVVTPMLSGAFSLGVFLGGRSSQHLLYFIDNGDLSGGAAKALKTIYYALPHFDLLDVSNSAVYGVSPSLENLLWSLAYSIGYAGVLLVLAAFIFKNREFN